MLSKIVWNRILTFEYSPTIGSEMEKKWISNAPVFGKTVFAVSELVFGVRTKANICFHYIFNKEQNDGSVVAVIRL